MINRKVDFPTCTQALGNITISGQDITDLSPLDQILEIEGDLMVVDNPLLASLEGLENVHVIHGELEIARNDTLEDLRGFRDLYYIGEQCNIYNNSSLVSLKGLDSLESSGGLLILSNPQLREVSNLNELNVLSSHLTIGANDSLQSIHQLEKLEAVAGDLTCYENPNLDSIDFPRLEYVSGSMGLFNLEEVESVGFENLRVVNGAMAIFNLDQLQNVDNIGSLERIGGLMISSNSSLENLDGFSNLSKVNDRFEILMNPSLSSIEGLANMRFGKLEHFQISQNLSLSSCAVDAICIHVFSNVADESSIVFSNGDDCVDHDAITSECKLVAVEERFTESLSIFPNPSLGNITLTGIDHEIDVELHNALGQLVFKQSGISSQIDLQLPSSSGIYTLSAKGNEISEVHRIIKQ